MNLTFKPARTAFTVVLTHAVRQHHRERRVARGTGRRDHLGGHRCAYRAVEKNEVGTGGKLTASLRRVARHGDVDGDR